MSPLTGIRANAAVHLPLAPPGPRTVAFRTPRPPSPGVSAPALRLVDQDREVCAICRSTVQAAVEVLAGTRPVQQLARRLDERCGVSPKSLTLLQAAVKEVLAALVSTAFELVNHHTTGTCEPHKRRCRFPIAVEGDLQRRPFALDGAICLF